MNAASRRGRAWVLCALFVALLLPGSVCAQGREPLLMPGKRSLYQRIVTRPGATLAANPSAEGAHDIPGFAVFYVYDRRGGDTGWVEVGRTANGQIAGWIPAAKTIDWKHTMIGAFTNPVGRQPVMFLNNAQAARQLILASDSGAQAARLRADAQAQPPRPGPVIALEPPGRFVNIAEKFYLLPILNAERLERETGPAPRLLEVISAPAETPRQQEAQRREQARNFKAGLVFLVDTTMSMQPYIEATRNAMTSIVGQIGASPLRNNFRFGLVAYRDSLEDTPELEYPARVFAKPDFNLPPESVLPAIAGVQESRASSIGFDEDPIGGLKMTIDEIDWESLTCGRFVVLITDSGARPATHPHSVTRMGISEIKALAQARGITIAALHLLTPAGAQINDHAPARAQYQEMTARNGGEPLYFPVPNGAPAEFANQVQALTTFLLQGVAEGSGQPGAAPQSTGPDNAARRRMREQIRVVSEAARLAYVGRAEGAQAPDVVRSWTTDRDLADPTILSLEIRVLLNRNQLSDLAQALQAILQAGIAGRTEPRTFFTQLRSAFAQTVRDPQRIAQANRIGALLGEYLEDLPYQSEIMDIREDDWLQMGAIGQRTVLNNIESKLRLYQEFQEHPELWIDLTDSRNPGEAVFPVPLEALP